VRGRYADGHQVDATCSASLAMAISLTGRNAIIHAARQQ